MCRDMLRVMLVTNDGNWGGVANVVSQLMQIEKCIFRLVCGSSGPFVKELQEEGRDVRVLDMGHSLRSLSPLFNLAKELNAFRPHLVHSHHPRAYLRGRIVSRLAGVPHISTPHSSLLDELNHRPGLTSWRRNTFLLRERAMAPLDTFTIALSDYQRDMLIRLGVNESQIRIIPNGIELNRFQLKESDPTTLLKKTYTIGVVGRVTKEKGVGDLIKVLAQLPKRIGGYSLELIVIGDGPDRRHFEELAVSLDVAEQIQWLGHRSDIPKLLQTIDVAVFPSYYEGMPLALIEAMAARRSIVAVDLPVFKSILAGKCGMVVPREKLAESIIDLLTSPGKADCLAHNARIKAAKEFDSQRVLHQTYQLYCEATMKI